MFSEEVVQLLGYKGGRDYQNDGWLRLWGHRHWDVNVTGRDETVCALEAVRYVHKDRYNLISIGVLDEEGFQIQVQ